MISYYIVQLLATMIAAIPAVIVTRFIYFKITKRKVNKHHEFMLILFVTFCAGLTTQTILPHNLRYMNIGFSLDNFNIIPFSTLIEMIYEKRWISILNIGGNIIMFAPFGFFPPILWNRFRLRNAAWLTFNISFCIEVIQLFVGGRATDIDDLILNTLGGILGWCVFYLLNKIFPKFFSKFLS